MKKALIILLLLTIPAFWALTKPGFFSSHDGDWMIIRLSAFHQSLRDGQFPVRWSSRLNHGFGYPVFNFLYPLPFYFGEIFYLISGSFTQAIKWVFLLSFPASALTMYLWLSKKFSGWASLAGALLYVYTPYRFVDTYVRGSVGESLAFVFIPLLFLSLDLLPKRTYLAVILGAISIAATILSHNVFVIFVLLAFIYGFLQKTNLQHLLVTFTLGAMLSAYFWLPALSELKYVYASVSPVTNPTNHLVSLKQLVTPPFQLGLVNLIILGLSMILLRRHFFLILSLISIFLIHRLSLPFWRLVPGISVIQFPWRLLAITTFASSVLLAHLVSKFKPLLILAIAAIVLTLPYTKPNTLTFFPDSFYSTNEDTTTFQQEYTPLWVKDFPRERTGDRIFFTQGRGFTTEITETNLSFDAKIEASENSVVKFARIYYPGWIAVLNGQHVSIDYSQNGLISVAIPKGVSIVSLRWQETPLRTLVNYISLITLLAVISHVACSLFWSPTSTPSRLKPARKPS